MKLIIKGNEIDRTDILELLTSVDQVLAFRNFMHDFSKWLRGEVKYRDQPYQEVKDKFWELVAEYELKLGE